MNWNSAFRDKDWGMERKTTLPVFLCISLTPRSQRSMAVSRTALRCLRVPSPEFNHVLPKVAFASKYNKKNETLWHILLYLIRQNLCLNHLYNMLIVYWWQALFFKPLTTKQVFKLTFSNYIWVPLAVHKKNGKLLQGTFQFIKHLEEWTEVLGSSYFLTLSSLIHSLSWDSSFLHRI